MSQNNERAELVQAEASGGRFLSRPEFRELAAVPAPEIWYQNLGPATTRKAYREDIAQFITFAGIGGPDELRLVKRPHVIAWRQDLEARGLAPSTIRRKLAAVSSLFNALCEENAVLDNPVRGVRRPPVETQEGKTPALSDQQAYRLLQIPPSDTLKGLRDRAILAILLYQGLRRAELCALSVGDYCERGGFKNLRIKGKGGKIRFLPLNPEVVARLEALQLAIGIGRDSKDPLFPRLHKGGKVGAGRLTPDGIYVSVVKFWAGKAGVLIEGFGPHSLRATAATNALSHESDIARVQEFLGHSNIQTTRMYDRRHQRPENSPAFAIRY
jgi:site-specific recombinase XerD